MAKKVELGATEREFLAAILNDAEDGINRKEDADYLFEHIYELALKRFNEISELE